MWEVANLSCKPNRKVSRVHNLNEFQKVFPLSALEIYLAYEVHFLLIISKINHEEESFLVRPEPA